MERRRKGGVKKSHGRVKSLNGGDRKMKPWGLKEKPDKVPSTGGENFTGGGPPRQGKG